MRVHYIYSSYAVADLEIFRGGFSLLAKLEMKTEKKKKGLHQLFEFSFFSRARWTALAYHPQHKKSTCWTTKE